MVYRQDFESTALDTFTEWSRQIHMDINLLDFCHKYDFMNNRIISPVVVTQKRRWWKRKIERTSHNSPVKLVREFLKVSQKGDSSSNYVPLLPNLALNRPVKCVNLSLLSLPLDPLWTISPQLPVDFILHGVHTKMLDKTLNSRLSLQPQTVYLLTKMLLLTKRLTGS